MTNPFAGLQQGMQAAGGLIDMFNAPRDRAFAMEQARQEMALEQARLDQGQQSIDLATREQDRLAQAQDQEQQKYRAAIFGSLAKFAKDLPMDERRKVAGALQQMIPGINLDDEALSDERLEAAAKAADVLSPPEPKEYEQGKGVMEGFAFDRSTGRFSIAPEVKSRLLTRPQGDLKMSDIRDINNDVTKLTQNAVGVREGAKALIDIGDSPTPAQAVAAIFKFMKSLDPTSVVRQEEQGLVANASGPMEAFAGYINKLSGQGPLTPEVMRDIIKTASGLANSTIEETDAVVKSHISVFPELSNERRKAMLNRIPSLVKIPEFFDVRANVGPDLPTMPEVGKSFVDPQTGQEIPGVKRLK